MNRPKTANARRIGPQLLAQQADDEHDFTSAVAEQVESVEMLLVTPESGAPIQSCRSISVEPAAIASVLNR